jgi:hypothetical protein
MATVWTSMAPAASAPPGPTTHYQGVATITTKQGFFTNTFARFEGAKLVDGKLTFPFRIEGKIADPKFSKGSKQ